MTTKEKQLMALLARIHTTAGKRAYNLIWGGRVRIPGISMNDAEILTSKLEAAEIVIAAEATNTIPALLAEYTPQPFTRDSHLRYASGGSLANAVKGGAII